MSEEWKIDMLRQLWSGNDSDSEKLSNDKSPNKKKSAGNTDWLSIDLHHFHDLSKQLLKAEEAIDKAILLNKNGITIIHGKGEGILRSQIIKMLKSHKHVATYKFINDNNNQSGALNVKFRKL